MEDLFLKILAGILAIFLAIKFIPGVSIDIFPGQTKFLGIKIEEKWQMVILIGIIVGLVNFFLKPFLKFITLPLRFLTFGLFGLFLNLALVEMVDVLFSELEIKGILPLFWTSLIIWFFEFILGGFKEK